MKQVGHAYYQAEMYAGRIACCPLVSHDKYAYGTDKQTDGRQTVTLYTQSVSVIKRTENAHCR